jgi:SHS2 domain-containing protein
METVSFFDHTADVGLRIESASLDGLFRLAAEGLFDAIVANREAVRGETVEPIQLAAPSLPELLATWLSELIFRAETQHTVYGRFDVQVEPEGPSLVARIAGEPIDRARHLLDHEVKAVTRHGLVLERRDGSWHAEVILDI